MKILLTSINGYLSTKLKDWLNSLTDFQVTQISLRGKEWEQKSFEGFDVVVHTAGLVHQKSGKFSSEEYFTINSQLTQKLALKAKREGVSHFVFISTLAVYGNEMNFNTQIKQHTLEAPGSDYGRSKLVAEKLVFELMDEQFIVSSIRIPMIYGPKCPGNYSLLRRLVRFTLIFPEINNVRSMIYIDNLTEFVRLVIENRTEGVLVPQDRNYMNISILVKEIAKLNKSPIYMSKLLGKVLVEAKAIHRNSILNKIFGSLVYDIEESGYFDWKYIKCDFKSALKNTEENWK
ncbi:NAD-dependent epimerase/dehydratase family protein [Cohnella sp. GCM10020058]|uniref:NAD-dependent epimerase/dehydratase family protein n=1 Tax=Cohnella sp. GCM10020058 TaxID=3317330 RepID=UPI00363C895E